MSTETLNIAQLKERVNLVDVVGKYLSLVKRGVEHFGMCPFHDDHKRSLKVNEDKKLWGCFVCNKGGDAIDFLVAYKGRSIEEAIKELREHAGDVVTERPKDLWRAILPPETFNAANMEIKHFKFGLPSRVWTYKTADGRLIGFVCRFDFPDGRKETWPYTYCTDGAIPGKWKWHGFSTPRALYNLPALVKRPDAIVLVVEGEKTADAAQEMYPEFVCTTWQGGARSVSHADWRPLGLRKVITWPDNDEAGREAMAEVRRILWANTKPPLRTIRIPAQMPRHWDVADQKGKWSVDEARQFLKTNIYNV